ncbi:MAG: methyltransferase domain-containing protein [Rhodobacteraceae bacterium]|nr:methyltransferase domain-containing protein [Paracoccaceae bacterium]
MIRRFFEIAKDDGIDVAIKKAIKYAPGIYIGRISKNFFQINSKSYWDFRLKFNWSKEGSLQTVRFSESLFEFCNIGDLDPPSVLDFGCAHGDSARIFRKNWPKSEIFLWDVSTGGLNIAVKKQENFGVKKWDQTTKCNFVYCSNVIEHIENVEEFVESLAVSSSKYVCIQCPWNERHLDGSILTSQTPIGEHVNTIDDAFLEKFINPYFTEIKVTKGDVPEAWPFGKQLFYLGVLK